jgi:antitoxin (DNA-binding transcriptional repressor) of toxin-antitoxin stability system
MRQIAFRDFRLQGAKALGKMQPGEAVVLANRQGPAYFLIPVESGAMEAQEEELKTAMALAAMRESWRRAEAAGLADLTMEEIDAEIAAVRKEAPAPRKRRAS